MIPSECVDPMITTLSVIPLFLENLISFCLHVQSWDIKLGILSCFEPRKFDKEQDIKKILSRY